VTAPRGSVPDLDWGALPPEALAEHLARQRWSGARGTSITDVRVAAWVPFPLADDAAPCAIAIVDGSVNGAPVRWQLPLVVREALTCDPVVVRDDGVPVCDATADAAFREALREALAAGRELEGRDAGGRVVRWRARRVGDDRRLDAPLPSRVGGAEQSNTSLLYGQAAIVKLFRRLESGPQPDVEIGGALAEVRFAHVPALLAVVELVADERRTVLGMAQALVPQARDAWEVAVAHARATLAAADDQGAAAARAAAEEEARRLGIVTRRLHDALAAVREPDFAPEPATPDDVRGWAADAARAFEQALEAIDAPEGDADGAGVGDARAALGTLAARGGELRARLERLAARAARDAGQRIRHHGDYHLGQVLRADDGTLAVIDFEGEPARPLEERRRRHSPLRDVAGMLRSFGYAAAAALREVGEDEPTAARAREWEAAARAAFLAGYFEPDGPGAAPAPGRPSYLPRERAAADALVRVFELEKLFYELRYEVRNRPDWLPIPLRGLTALLASTDRDDAAMRTPLGGGAA
jgi:maltose alpha-D-glucosyltransferase/alpha-amylase